MNLFKLSENSFLTSSDLSDKLKEIGAHDCEVLYIHSSLNFGLPNPKIKSKEVLTELFEVISGLNVPTICMPTFTFSFCNGKDYDPLTSKSKMGALNEFFRKQEGVIRSMDPLMSVAVKGKDTYLATDVSTHSISDGSTYDMLHGKEGVKFLFLGPRIGDCFTYMHYLEWLYSVDYRYIRHFHGNVIVEGIKKRADHDLFVRYKGVVPNDKTFAYEDWMVEENAAKRIQLGNGFLSIVGEKNGSEYYKRCLQRDPHFFVDIQSEMRDKTFQLTKEMVAL